ncbi:ATP-binding protein [Paenibacillus xylanilyticus]
MKRTTFVLKPKSIMLLIAFIVILTALRLVWFDYSQPAERPMIDKGVLDLSSLDLSSSKPITLDGEWDFYPGQEDIGTSPDLFNKPQSIQVPGDWKKQDVYKEGSASEPGTYRLRMLVNLKPDEVYTFWFNKIQSASRVTINGKVAAEFGEFDPAYVPRSFGHPEFSTYTASYVAPENVHGISEIELYVEIRPFAEQVHGGIVSSVQFGTQAAIDTKRWYSIGFQLFTIVIMLLHMIYAFILFLFKPGQREFLKFALLLLVAAISISTDNDNLFAQWLPFSYAWTVKIRLTSYILLSTLILSLTHSFFKQHTKVCRVLYGVGAVYIVSLFLMPFPAVTQSAWLFYAIFNLQLAVALWMIIKIKIQKLPDGLFLILAALAILSSCLWGIVQHATGLPATFYPMDMIAAIICFSSYWFKKYFRHTMENERYALQLELSDKMKDEFLANTSHELRTPLHGIINIAETIISNEKATLQETSVQDMKLLVQIGRRMSTLLNDLMDIARLQEKRIVLHPESVRLQSLAFGVVDMLRFMIKGKPLTIRVDIPEELPAVWADEKRLIQVIFNLMHNAIKYTPQGEVIIQAIHYGNTVSVHVKDTGVGMDEDTSHRVLGRYEQGAEGMKESGGFGLGLSISTQLLQLHGSELQVDSVPGRGSDFYFNLPLSSQQVQSVNPTNDDQAKVKESRLDWPTDMLQVYDLAAAAEQSDSYPATKMSILAVDDDPVNLEVLTRILSRDMYEIVPALSGQEALELLSSRPWNLVIADVMMPHMSGYELTRRIRDRFTLAELPVLLLTARSQPEDIYNGFAAGASDYVSKPVNALELRYRVGALTTLKQSFTEHLRMEAAYLQAQIQPHFLFNTLNSLMALSEIDTEKMRHLGDAFSTYLRYSFQFINLQQLVPLSHELDLVNAYLYIEKERFGPRIDIKRNMDTNLNTIMLPPLTLQPLVENAIRHGLLSKRSGGTLTIDVKRQDGGVHFRVSDNGKGMSPEEADKVLGLRFGSSLGGIGLRNTNRRLLQLYDSGLTISSMTGIGTTVSFFIPDEVQPPFNK